MKCKLVDVFAHRKLSGNGLTIFYDFDNLTSADMLSLTQEMRQFESIFLSVNKGQYKAKIFTLEEELDFAGHPLIGLAAHLHEEYGSQTEHQWCIDLNHQQVVLTTQIKDDYFEATMNQGDAHFIHSLSQSEAFEFLSVLNLVCDDIAEYPLEVISTGLPYLIIPIIDGIERVKIKTDILESMLEKIGAKFIFVLDMNNFEGRTWDNLGQVEDIATGSAAGPAAAYLYKHQFVSAGHTFQIKQGRFAGRPSEMTIFIDDHSHERPQISVKGQVCKIANINFV